MALGVPTMYCPPRPRRNFRFSSLTMPRSITQTLRPTVFLLHRLDDLFHRRRVVAVSGEDLVAQRNAVFGHHQADADLQTVRATVARVAALRSGLPRHWPSKYVLVTSYNSRS